MLYLLEILTFNFNVNKFFVSNILFYLYSVSFYNFLNSMLFIKRSRKILLNVYLGLPICVFPNRLYFLSSQSSTLSVFIFAYKTNS